jgi:hypothetical protein
MIAPAYSSRLTPAIAFPPHSCHVSLGAFNNGMLDLLQMSSADEIIGHHVVARMLI